MMRVVEIYYSHIMLCNKFTNILKCGIMNRGDVINMQNLYNELVEILTKNCKTIKDIKFISVDRGKFWESDYIEIDIDNFLEVAKDTNYDDGYGSVEIPISLKIVGDDWWIERYQYDGSEWFTFKTKPIRPSKIEHIDNIVVD